MALNPLHDNNVADICIIEVGNKLLSLLDLDHVHTVSAEFENGMKFLQLALQFHTFSYRHCVNGTPKCKNFMPYSNSASIV